MYLQDGSSFLVVRKSDRKEIEKEGRVGFNYHSILNQNLLNLNVDIVHLTVAPHAVYEPTSTDGYEFKYILSGQIEYVIGEESTVLKEGDSIFFDARIPHYPKASSQKVEILVVYFLFPG
jgi:quercetin dioxygenase-like cupin family protein